ncbi:MAG: cyclase [Omnitrophica bacterium RIFCSPLOWO2_12_FULL_50_11]|nr:MAG: cyclase [Omnitrophica bacterium RIFCSPLOWO2_12_FULL_50_11]
MRTFMLTLVLSSFLSFSVVAQDFPEGKVIDLTHSYDEETIYWPTAGDFELANVAAGVTEEGYYYYANRFSAAEHGGTHIDAPRHFFEGANTVDQIPLEQLMGHGVLVDVSEKCSKDPDYQIEIDDLLKWEEEFGTIPVDSIVFLKTGYGKHWPDRVRYMGTDERGSGALQKLHFPGLHPDAARWLVEERKMKAVGLDTPSIDYGQSTLFETHVALFEKNVPALENLAHLDQLPAKGFTVIALPMKIKGGSGGPTRVIAILE